MCRPNNPDKRVFVAVPDTLPLAVPNRSADLPRTHAPAGSAFDHSYRRFGALDGHCRAFWRVVRFGTPTRQSGTLSDTVWARPIRHVGWLGCWAGRCVGVFIAYFGARSGISRLGPHPGLDRSQEGALCRIVCERRDHAVAGDPGELVVAQTEDGPGQLVLAWPSS
jgi:hypothetical protein